MHLARLSHAPKPIPEERLSIEIERERMRADRTGREFSLVIFRNEGREDRRLLDDLRERVRSTDAIGRLESGELAALLPETTHRGATVFARQVCEMAPEMDRQYSLFTYPSGEVVEGVSDRARERGVIEGLFLEPVSPWKRLADVIGASILLLVTAPLMLVGALITRLGSPGPVLFKQTRIGFGGQPFTMWKFRTMRADNTAARHSEYFHSLVGSATPMTKIDEDQPLTPLGRLMRATCLDELPQLFNVLRGEMSLVGPRPCLPYEEKDYLPWQRERFQTLPGMTGLWQVSGKNHTTFTQMMRLDVRYARRHSFWLDSWILIKTLPVVILESGAGSFFARREDE